MQIIEKLNNDDVARFRQASEEMRKIKASVEKVNELMAPYKELYFPTLDGSCWPIKDELLDDEYGIGGEYVLWLEDEIGLLDYIAVSVEHYRNNIRPLLLAMANANEINE